MRLLLERPASGARGACSALNGLAPATTLGTDAVAARAVYEALAKGELKYFDPVARFPGFARATASTLGELRSAAVTADELSRLRPLHETTQLYCVSSRTSSPHASIADRTVLLRAAAETLGPAEPWRAALRSFSMCPFIPPQSRTFLLLWPSSHRRYSLPARSGMHGPWLP